jgi:ribosomal protein S18 acetylase RimI-like enzyme
MLTLRPMTETEYQPYIAWLREDYARERAESSATPLEEERANSNQQIDGLVPHGVATPNHHFWMMTDEAGAVVGNLWVFVDPDKRRAFIYDIAIAEARRGQGLGRQALTTLEDTLRPMGVRRIALNVFGKNTVARHLYETQGYSTVAIVMQKDI